ncbi:DUF3999 family protein [Marinicella rhabdoformis]|uniref:DUF3999 family protein n=1 Tax=Marinicella rhabdoformis TaxID=2580566 RepID=UPI0012AED5BA|nr:DUF3999 family protein [Marinicella rhabdoformis]
MMIKCNFKTPAIVAGMLLSLSAAAVDFKFKQQLNTKDTEAMGFQLTVPEHVYQQAQNPQLHDLRVLNTQGDQVPMKLSLMADDIERKVFESTLPIFSLNHTVNTPLKSKQVTTSWQGDLQQLTVETSESVQRFIKSQEQKRNDRFLLDATSLRQAQVTGLTLDWQFESAGNRVFYVEVKGSNDLSSWKTLKSRHKLIELNTGQRVVLENQIPLYAKAFDYYQLRFLGQPVPQVNSVKASLSSHSTSQSLTHKRILSYEILDPEQHGYTIIWQTDGVFPIESYAFDFQYKNLMADVQLYSKATENSRWQKVTSGQFYQLGTGEMAMEKNSLNFRPNNHRYWKLTTQSNISSQWINGLSFAWRPHQLQFLAQGDGPYSLNYGAKALNRPANNRWYQQLSSQVKSNMFSSEVTAGNVTELAPKPKAEPKPPEAKISRWIFWGLLVIVLSGLFYMASRLMREVSNDE